MKNVTQKKARHIEPPITRDTKPKDKPKLTKRILPKQRLFAQDDGIKRVQQLATRAVQQGAKDEVGGGLLGDIGEMVKGWVGAGVRAGTSKEENLRNEIADLRDKKPLLDQKVALLGGKVKLAKEEEEKLGKEFDRLTMMADAAVQGGDDNAAAGYLIQREDIVARQATAKRTREKAQGAFDQAMELRTATLGQIEQKIKQAHESLDRAEAAKIDHEVAGALQEISNSMEMGVGDADVLIAELDKKSAQGEAALDIAMQDNGALKDMRILNTARQKKGGKLLEQFKAERAQA